MENFCCFRCLHVWFTTIIIEVDMFLGFMLGFFTFAMANTEDDLLYEAEALLKNKECSDAERVTKKLIRDFPSQPKGYKLQAKAWECLGSRPEKVYQLFEEYLLAGGSEEEIKSEMAALDRQLFQADVTVVFDNTQLPFTLDDLTFKVEPIVVPNRESHEVTAQRRRWSDRELKPIGNKYSVKGLVPGRYAFTISSDSRLIKETQIKVEGVKNGRLSKKLTIKSVYEDFQKSVKQNNCTEMDKIINDFGRDLEEKDLFQWQMSAKLCTAKKDNTPEIWTDVLSFANQNEANLTQDHIKKLRQYSGIFSLELVDQNGESIPSATVVINGGEGQKLQGDVLEFGWMPFQTVRVNVDAGAYYEPLVQSVQFSSSNSKQIRLIIQKRPSTVIKLPKFDEQLSLSLQTNDNVRIDLEPLSDVEVLLEEYTFVASCAGETNTTTLRFQEGQDSLPLPWAYIVKSEGRDILTSIEFANESISLSHAVALDLPESPTVSLIGTVEPKPGVIQSFQITLEKHPATEKYATLETTREQIKKEKRRVLLAGGSAVVATAVAGLFQVNTLQSANNARSIDSVDGYAAYREYVDETRSRQNVAYIGYGGMGVLSSFTLWRWTVNNKHKAQEIEHKNQYQLALEQPIVLNQ